MEPTVGIEPTACRLRGGCSTTELRGPEGFTRIAYTIAVFRSSAAGQGWFIGSLRVSRMATMNAGHKSLTSGNSTQGCPGIATTSPEIADRLHKVLNHGRDEGETETVRLRQRQPTHLRRTLDRRRHGRLDTRGEASPHHS